MHAGAATAVAGVAGWNYNRTNYKFDQGLRWKRYIAGRQFSVAQFGMFREDVSDLTSVATNKLKIYAPVMVLGCAYCLQILVEGRSGTMLPGPPTFISGLYFQCVGVAFLFFVLGAWLALHAAMRAQVASAQLRTRKVRLPVPTQRQLDSARKLLSTFEEQIITDMVGLPYVMPNGGDSPRCNEPFAKGKSNKNSKGSKLKAELGKGQEKQEKGLRMPGFTKGNPTWANKEVDADAIFPKASSNGFGKDGTPQPYEHFELVREAQKEWWCAEAYMRICFLFGYMHLILALAYWVVIHCVSELLMIWCANLCAAALTATVWLMFRLDVLPEAGGSLPLEACGPFLAAVALALAYTRDPRQSVIDIERGIAIFIVSLQIVWTLRLYAVSRPSSGNPDHMALERGGNYFNRSAACDKPAWLPKAFQHVSYMIAPPKTKEQLARENKYREGKAIADDEMIAVDMTPWYYVRAAFIVILVGWAVQISGLIVEAIMGERMLTTIPGAPPWTRAGQWFGWEHGPTTSKNFAHISPARGHFLYMAGWGPNGQQDLWDSDNFGFHPEADMYWAEPNGPSPLISSAGIGSNTWSSLRLKYTNMAPQTPPVEAAVAVPSIPMIGNVMSPVNNGLSRRLHSVVPAAVQWPALLEPELLSCGAVQHPGHIFALSSNGVGAFVEPSGAARSFALDGLVSLGQALAVTWGHTNLLVAMSTGTIASCPIAARADVSSHCAVMAVPLLPLQEISEPAVSVFEESESQSLRAALSLGHGRIGLFQLSLAVSEGSSEWRSITEVALPADTLKIVALSAGQDHLIAMVTDGSVLRWQMQDGLFVLVRHEMPAETGRNAWKAACALPDGKIVRLASAWQSRAKRPYFKAELFF